MNFVKIIIAMSLFLTLNLYASVANESRSINTMIALDQVTTITELHHILKVKLDLPDYYGENWDAFYDAMSDVLNEKNVTLFLSGRKAFRERFPRDSDLFFETLKDLQEVSPGKLVVLGRRD